MEVLLGFSPVLDGDVLADPHKGAHMTSPSPTVPTTVIALDGEIDGTETPRLREEVLAALAAAPAALILDLTSVTFFDSMGVALLVEAHVVAGSTTSLIVVADQRCVLRPPGGHRRRQCADHGPDLA
ncbi:STAS domain-containing protein [Umezawaea sp. NPDC059074]|uniref:STAS domain-containing protein n=1 Tax=Umezawaea sp. NPDC059074 TaxID=3346716 RepID=UPI0036BE1480